MISALRAWLQRKNDERLERKFRNRCGARLLASLVARASGGVAEFTSAELLDAPDLWVSWAGDRERIVVKVSDRALPGFHSIALDLPRRHAWLARKADRP